MKFTIFFLLAGCALGQTQPKKTTATQMDALAATANAASNLGYVYGQTAQLFKDDPSVACRFLREVDNIRDEARYQFPSIEKHEDMKAMRKWCRKPQSK